MTDRSSRHNPDYDLSPKAERVQKIHAYAAKLEVVGEQMLAMIHELAGLLTE